MTEQPAAPTNLQVVTRRWGRTARENVQIIRSRFASCMRMRPQGIPDVVFDPSPLTPPPRSS